MSAYSLSVCCIVSMSVFTCQNGLLFLCLSSSLSAVSCRFTLAGNCFFVYQNYIYFAYYVVIVELELNI